MRTARLRRLVAAVVAVVTVTVVLAATAPVAGSAPLDQWSATFCRSLDTMLRRVIKARDALGATLGRPDYTTTEGKAAVVAYLGAVVGAIDGVHARMKTAGAPETTNGSKIQSTVLQALADSRAHDAGLRGEARDFIQTSDVATFQATAEPILEVLAEFRLPAIDSAMPRVAKLDHDHALRREFAKYKACQGLLR